MNAILRLDGIDFWHVAGWTMLHYLWLGALAGVAAAALRLVSRGAAANVRYVAALGCLAVLALLPVAIAAWVGTHSLRAASSAGAVAASPAIVAASDILQPLAVTKSPGLAGRPVSELAGSERKAAHPGDSIVSTETKLGAALSASAPAELPSAVSDSSPLAISLLRSSAHYLPWLWLIGTPLTFLLLATGVLGSERLRRSSRIIYDGPIADASTRLVDALQIGRGVTVAICERIAAPVLVGIIRPIILLPPAALTGWSPDEVEMVLLHELAHVRRWDNLVNLVQRLVEAVLFFNPAVWLVSSWVRREREACCDAVVVGRTNRPHAYAEFLVALATQLPRSVIFHPTAASAMAAGPLRSCIRRILKVEDDPMLISGKSLGMVMSGLLLAATLVVLNLPARGQAKESRPEVAKSFPASETHTYGLATNPPIELSEEEGQRIVAEALRNLHVREASIVRLPDGRQVLRVRLDKIAGKRPFVAWDKDAEGKLNCRIEFIDAPANSTVSPTPTLRHVDDGFQSRDGHEFMEVPFVQGATSFRDGDNITILEVRGTAGTIRRGNIYRIKGTYKLRSHDRAKLDAYVTAKDAAHGTSPSLSVQSTNVNRGDGTFTLFLPMLYRGWPHVSFYPADGGEGFGGVYFGTGDSVLKQWWGSNDAVDLTDEDALQSLFVVSDGNPLLTRSYPVPSSAREKLSDGLEGLRLDRFGPQLKFESRWNGDQSVFEITAPERAHVAFFSKFIPQLVASEEKRPAAAASDASFAEEATTAAAKGSGVTGTRRYGMGGNLPIEVTDEAGRRIVKELLKNPAVQRASINRTPDGMQSIFVSIKEPPGKKAFLAWNLDSEGRLTCSLKFIELPRNSTGRDQPKQSTAKSTEARQANNDVRRVTIALGDGQTATAESQPGRLRMQIRKTGSKSSRFPSLEEQKLADLAWERLGLELEPIGGEDLSRVQALGYGGGLRIAGSRQPMQRARDFIPTSFKSGDILVGLHVWPTKSLKDVAEILNRDDLAELNPLKFYVVRSVPKNGGGFGPDEMVDTIVTGRISVNLDTQRRQLNPNPFALDPDLDSGPTKPTEAPASPLSSAPAAPRPRDRVGLVPTNKRTAQAQVPAAAPGEDKSTLRYEGRTFGEWRQDWLNHGPLEFEALTALQAFAAAGYGQEATDLVASGVYSESAAIAQRSRRFLSMLPKPEAERVVARLISVLESELSSRRRIDLIRAIAAIGPNANSAMEVLKQSMANKEPQERIAAAAAIKMIVGKDQYQKPVADVLGKELGITVVETDSRWAALPREDVKDGGKAFADFTKAVIEEQQQLFPGGKF